MNDLWKFDPTSEMWSFVSGSTIANQPGDYDFSDGIIYPGGRYFTYSWGGTDGNLWIFGGYGYKTSTYGREYMNDLWKFVPGGVLVSTGGNPGHYTPSVVDPLGNAVISIVQEPQHGTADLAPGTTGTIVYTPDPGYFGSDSVVIGISNGTCPITTQTIQIKVVQAGVSQTDVNLDGAITPMDTDTDGDGFPDTIETLLETSTTDSGETPTGQPDTGFNVFNLGTKALKVKPNKKTQLEKVKIKGLIEAPVPESYANQKVAIDLGGNPILFSLDAKGKATIGKNKFTVKAKKSKTGPPLLQFSLAMQGQFIDNFKLNGPLDGNGNPSRVTLEIYFNGAQYSSTQAVLYK